MHSHLSQYLINKNTHDLLAATAAISRWCSSDMKNEESVTAREADKQFNIDIDIGKSISH